MRRVFILFFLLVKCSITISQIDINYFTENKFGGTILYVSNNEYCPVSIVLEVNLNNMLFSEGSNRLFVVPARTDSMKIGKFTQDKDGKRFSFTYRTKYFRGNSMLSSFDSLYEYDLPFANGKTFEVGQGYNGKKTHQNENALDFSMGLGNEIFAARDGVVIKVVDKNNYACTDESCKEYNNMVTIYHSDGTMADYAHIQQNGSRVKVGDKVKKGSLIAISGNTGWSSGPHLHFCCYFYKGTNRVTIETKFKMGRKIETLKEGEKYTKEL